MGNLKHTIAAIVAVSMVSSLAAVQLRDGGTVNANKLAREVKKIETVETEDTKPEVLKGDGEGETVDFDIQSPANQIYVGKDAYILTSGGSINFRAEPNTESTILNVLKVGDAVKVLENNGEWFKIESGDYTGYVKSEFVTLDYEKVQGVLLSTTMYRYGTVLKGINVYSLPNEDEVILDYAGEGEQLVILSSANGWYEVYFGDNYDVGYVSAQFVSVGDMVERKAINSKRASRIAEVARDAKISCEGSVDVKTIPSDKGDTFITLENGTKCRVISGGANWTKILVLSTNQIGYVRTSNVAIIIPEVKKAEAPAAKEATDKSDKTTNKSEKKAAKTVTKTAKEASGETPASASGSKLVQQAAKYIGTKYVYGGSSPSGFDCSGLVQYCCRKLGVSVNRSAASQFSNGVAVSKENLQPGDLVFFSRGSGISHVAIYAGNGQVIHSPRTGKTVCYQSLATMCSYSKYVGARRVM